MRRFEPAKPETAVPAQRLIAMLLGLLHEGTDPFVDSGKSTTPFIGYQLAGEIGHFLLFSYRAKPYFQRSRGCFYYSCGEKLLHLLFWRRRCGVEMSKNEKMSALALASSSADAATNLL